MIVGVDVREWQGDRRTGIGRFLEEFLRVAHGARPADRFLLLGNGDTRTRVRGDNVTFTRLRERWTPWWDQVTLPRSLRQGGVDLFYSPYIKAPLAARVPVVNTVHDLTFFVRADYNRRRRDLVLNVPFRLFCRAMVKRSTAIIVDSAASARDVERLLCADRAKIKVVPLATSPAFRPDADRAADAAALARFGLEPGYVLYVGGFWPHKNLPQAIRAHAALPDSLRLELPLTRFHHGHYGSRQRASQFYVRNSNSNRRRLKISGNTASHRRIDHPHSGDHRIAPDVLRF